MFSSTPKLSPQKKLVEIDQQLSEIPIYQHVLRNDLREEKKKLVAQVKAKEKESQNTLEGIQ